MREAKAKKKREANLNKSNWIITSNLRPDMISDRLWSSSIWASCNSFLSLLRCKLIEFRFARLGNRLMWHWRQRQKRETKKIHLIYPRNAFSFISNSHIIKVIIGRSFMCRSRDWYSSSGAESENSIFGILISIHEKLLMKINKPRRFPNDCLAIGHEIFIAIIKYVK